ncbi:SDR family NAD(P)-dependent oxidoreductase [Pseudoroseomonas wenyumeiae]
MKTTGNTILVTGGTSGIGRAIAERFHDRGNRVIVTGRRQALLDQIAAARPGLIPMPLDLDDPASLPRLTSEVRACFLTSTCSSPMPASRGWRTWPRMTGTCRMRRRSCEPTSWACCA